MSFILDALRKSESERRRSATPMLAGVPIEVTRSAVPAWLWALIAVLALAVLVLGGAWWTGYRPPATSSAPMAQSAAVPTLPAQDGPAAVTPVQPAEQGATGVETRATSAAGSTPPPTAPSTPAPTAGSATPAASTPRPEPQPPTPADAAPAATARVAAAPAPQRGSLPTVAEARAAGVELPTLTIELHVYHSTPASRWVYINGTRYTQGRQLADGPELVEIVPEGVVIRQSGSEYLLLAQ